jgi:uncharacterized protein YjbI with pentapeptide repeats
MTENPLIDKEIEEIIQRVQESQTDNFFELAKMLGRDPKNDYTGANLHKCDLSNGDLQGAILRQTDLSYANLSGTDLSGADLSDADLSGADLSGADLTYTNLSNAQLKGVIVKNTLLGNNIGLSSADEYYLKERSAIFRDLQTKSNTTTSNPYKQRYYNDPSFWGFLKYFFSGDSDSSSNVYEMAAIEIVENDQTTLESEAIEKLKNEQITKSSINFITRLFSWCLSISFMMAFGVILCQALILGNERANIVMYHTFTLILGCFIGALTTYLRMASEQKIN